MATLSQDPPLFSLDDLLRPDPLFPSYSSDASFDFDHPSFGSSTGTSGGGSDGTGPMEGVEGGEFDLDAFLVEQGQVDQARNRAASSSQLPSLDFSSQLDFLGPHPSTSSNMPFPTSAASSTTTSTSVSPSMFSTSGYIEPFAFPAQPHSQPSSEAFLSSFLASQPAPAPNSNGANGASQRDAELLRQAQERIFAQLRASAPPQPPQPPAPAPFAQPLFDEQAKRRRIDEPASRSTGDKPFKLKTGVLPPSTASRRPASRSPPSASTAILPPANDVIDLVGSAGLPPSASLAGRKKSVAPVSAGGKGKSVGGVPIIAPKLDVRPSPPAQLAVPVRPTLMSRTKSDSDRSSDSGSGSAQVKNESGGEEDHSVTDTSSSPDSLNASRSGPKVALPAVATGKKAAGGEGVSKGKRLAAEKKALEDKKKKGMLLELHGVHGGAAMGHNAVEKRYRENINAHIGTLRELIPALRHLSDPTSSSQPSVELSPLGQPEGLIDGVLPASKISKGIVLAKAVEYILSLQLQRQHLVQDLDRLQLLVADMVEGGRTVLDRFEEEKTKVKGKREEELERLAVLGVAALGEGASEEEDTEPVGKKRKQPPASTSSSASKGLLHPASAGPMHSRRRSDAGTASSASSSGAGSPPSHGWAASSIDPSLLTSISSASSTTSSAHSPPFSAFSFNAASPTSPTHQPPRMLFAAFLGVSFVGGAGWEWLGKAAGGAAEGQAGAGPSAAWALGKIVRRSLDTTLDPSSTLASGAGSAAANPWSTGLVALGTASIFCTVLFVLWPVVVALANLGTGRCEEIRRHRRAAALVALADSEAGSSSIEKVDDVHAHLVEFVGAPEGTIALVWQTAKEGVEATVREVVGGKGSRAVDEQDAAAWVRMAEIQCSPTMDFSRLRSFHTFLRLLNLSRSTRWPSQHHLTAQARVKGILAIHHVRNSHFTKHLAATLWRRAYHARDRDHVGEDEGRDDVVDEWTSLAVSTGFNEMSGLVVSRATKAKHRTHQTPKVTDTMPLLLVAESRYEVALVDTWAKIFVSVIRATCAPRKGSAASWTTAAVDVGNMTDLAKAASLACGADSETVVAAIELINGAIEKILASTLPGTEIHALASVTAGVWFSAFGDADAARTFAQTLALDAKAGGPAAKLSSARLFLTLIAGPTSPWLDHFEAVSPAAASEVDFLACATLQWLLVARRYSALVGRDNGPTKDAALQESTVHLRRLLGSPVFASPAIVAASVGEPAEARRKKGLDPEFDMADAVDLCVDALTQMGRKCAGIEDDDSGYETL